MPFVTVSQGGSDLPDDVYPVVLVGISDPKTVTAQRGPKAGQDIDLLDWTFAIVDGDFKDQEITASTSTASGPKSKMYSYITALLGGKAPQVGQSFEKTDFVGRLALATVRKDENGWPRIENLGAMPTAMLEQRLAAATGLNLEPAKTPAPKPLREQIASGNVPF